MYYQVADYPFEIITPPNINCRELLPWFAHFECEAPYAPPLLFRFNATKTILPSPERVLLEQTENDMGNVSVWQTPEGFSIETGIIGSEYRHTMTTRHDFRHIEATIQWDDPYISQMLSSMIRIAFSQAILREDGISIHASAVSYKKKAYLFLGKSGTGKSTHASLWTQHIPGTELINDDNPTLRIIEGKGAYIYGTPWSGKTPCYKNVCYPLGGITRLQQATANTYTRLNEWDAFVQIMPSCAVIKQNIALYTNLCDKLVWISENIVVGLLRCLPDREAAITSLRAMTQKYKEINNP